MFNVPSTLNFVSAGGEDVGKDGGRVVGDSGDEDVGKDVGRGVTGTY